MVHYHEPVAAIDNTLSKNIWAAMYQGGDRRLQRPWASSILVLSTKTLEKKNDS